jgi:hypothetical protein
MKESVGELEGEVKDLGELSERMRELSRDMDQRQTPSAKRLSTLTVPPRYGRTAAAAAATLGERAREIDQSLGQADERLAAAQCPAPASWRVAPARCRSCRRGSRDSRLASLSGAE